MKTDRPLSLKRTDYPGVEWIKSMRATEEDSVDALTAALLTADRLVQSVNGNNETEVDMNLNSHQVNSESQSTEFTGLKNMRTIDFEEEPAHALTIALRTAERVVRKADELMITFNNLEEKNQAKSIEILNATKAVLENNTVAIRDVTMDKVSIFEETMHKRAEEIILWAQVEHVKEIKEAQTALATEFIKEIGVVTLDAVRTAIKIESDQLTRMRNDLITTTQSTANELNKLIASANAVVEKMAGASGHELKRKGLFNRLYEAFSGSN